jgi:hypothetical protein
MYKKITLCALCCAFLSFNSCKNGNLDNDAPVPAGMVRLDLTKAGIPATIDVPDTTHKVYGIESQSSGSIHVFVGKGFHVLINVSGETVTMKKNDINGDDLNKPKTWVVNDTNALVYSTQKDTNAFANAKEEFHFYTIVRKGKAVYYVQDLQQGANGDVYVFSQQDAQTMYNSAKSLTPAAPPAKS